MSGLAGFGDGRLENFKLKCNYRLNKFKYTSSVGNSPVPISYFNRVDRGKETLPSGEECHP